MHDIQISTMLRIDVDAHLWRQPQTQQIFSLRSELSTAQCRIIDMHSQMTVDIDDIKQSIAEIQDRAGSDGAPMLSSLLSDWLSDEQSKFCLSTASLRDIEHVYGILLTSTPPADHLTPAEQIQDLFSDVVRLRKVLTCLAKEQDEELVQWQNRLANAEQQLQSHVLSNRSNEPQVSPSQLARLPSAGPMDLDDPSSDSNVSQDFAPTVSSLHSRPNVSLIIHKNASCPSDDAFAERKQSRAFCRH